MSEANLKALAASLSEAQRNALLSFETADDASRSELARLNLAWNLAAHFNFETGRSEGGGWKLRTLGLSLRTHILKEQRNA